MQSAQQTILTVTLNTGIDRTLVVPHFHWGETIRTSAEAVGIGAKGTDASWVLAELGYPTMAIGFAAGASGELMERMLVERGVRTGFTWVEGETRTNIVLLSSAGEGQSTMTTNSLLIQPEHIQAFCSTYQQALSEAACVIIGGSLPPNVPAGLYTDLVRQARQQALPVIFDASGAELRLGLEGHPTLVKPNRDELQDLVGMKIQTVEDAYSAACLLRNAYGCMVVATLGDQGALAVLDDKAWFICPLQMKVKSTAGAGDAILAGLATALAAKQPVEDGLRLGFAAAAAVLMTLPTADCRKQDVYEIFPRIQILPYAKKPSVK